MFGLDISDASIEALELKKSFGKIKLVGYARMELPEGIVRDGIVLKKKELGKAIKKLLASAKPYPIKSREVILSLPESRVFTHIFKFPVNLKTEQISHILQFEVPNVMPVSFEEIYYDFVVLDKINNEQEIFFVAVPKKVVDDLTEVIHSIGLKPKVFDMESASLARALGKEAENSLIVDIGARTTIISIFNKKGIRFTTNIGIAGNLLTEAIAKKLKIKWDEAESLKKTCGFNLKDSRCREGQVFLIVQSVIQPILKEIQKARKFYEEKSGQKIRRIILCGGSALMPNIENYFKENLGLEIIIGSPYLAPKVEIKKEKINPLLLNVFGLALRGVLKQPEQSGVNLIGGSKKTKVLPKKKTLIWLLVLALILFFGAAGYLFYEQPDRIPIFGERFLPKVIPLEFSLQIKTEEPIFGRVLEVEKEMSKLFPATGKRIIEGQAKGKVKIFNNTLYNQTLVSGTRLYREEEGVTFRTKEQVTVPAGGAVEVEVYADEIGAAGDVLPGKFIIPGLPISLQKLIYAESEEPMTGGATEVKIVSADDIEKAKEKLLKEIIESVRVEAEAELAEGEILLPEILDSEIVQVTAEPGQDEAADEFNLQMAVKIKFLVLFEKAFEEKMREELLKRGIRKIDLYQFSEANYSLIDFDSASGKAVIKVAVKAVKL